jgi:hypothetical protein
LPTADHAVGEHAGTGDAAFDRELDRLRRQHLLRRIRRALFPHKLLVDELHDHGRCRAPLEHLSRLRTDQLESVEPFALHLGRHDLDRHARPRRGEGFAHGLAASVLGNRLLRRRRGRECGALASQHEFQNREGQLRIVARQSLGLLPHQSALQPLVFLLQQAHELLVLVALVRELRDQKLRIFQARFGFTRRCRVHDGLVVRHRRSAVKPCRSALTLS